MSKIAKFGCEMWSNAENIALQSLQILYTFVLQLLQFLMPCRILLDEIVILIALSLY